MSVNETQKTFHQSLYKHRRHRAQLSGISGTGGIGLRNASSNGYGCNEIRFIPLNGYPFLNERYADRHCEHGAMIIYKLFLWRQHFLADIINQVLPAYIGKV